MAQSVVLRTLRVQLIRGLVRTIEKADLSADGRHSLQRFHPRRVGLLV